MAVIDTSDRAAMVKAWQTMFGGPSPVETFGPERRPDFLCIGSEKSGTTWLWRCMMAHPGIGVPATKELRYFNRRFDYDLVHFRALSQFLDNPRASPTRPDFMERIATELRLLYGGLPAYYRIFGQLSQPVVGELTPQYCFQPLERIRQMHDAAPEARILYLLRDPVDRLLSGARMVVRRDKLPLCDLELEKAASDPLQLRLTDALAHLELFEAVFGDDRVKVFFFDDISERPAGLIDDICAFIGAQTAKLPDTDLLQKVNEGAAFQPSNGLKRTIYHKIAPLYARLEPRFPQQVARWRSRYEG
jgi:hypothetical protein